MWGNLHFLSRVTRGQRPCFPDSPWRNPARQPRGTSFHLELWHMRSEGSPPIISKFLKRCSIIQLALTKWRGAVVCVPAEARVSVRGLSDWWCERSGWKRGSPRQPRHHQSTVRAGTPGSLRPPGSTRVLVLPLPLLLHCCSRPHRRHQHSNAAQLFQQKMWGLLDTPPSTFSRQRLSSGVLSSLPSPSPVCREEFPSFAGR